MAAKRRRKRSKEAPGWVWMLFGLSLGLVVALAVYLRAIPGPPAGGAPQRAGIETPAPPPAAAPEQRPSAQTERRTQPEAASADARFDFYEMLPQFEVVIPEVETDVRPDTTPRPIEQPGRYVLQVGSFSRLEDADRLKASLALLGIESRIQRVMIDADTFHRVRVGPISDLAEVNRMRNRLREARVDTLLMKVPE